MSDKPERVWVQGMYAKEKTFDNGGRMQKIWIKVDEFCDFIKSNAVNGSVNFNMAGSREPRMDDNGDEKLSVWVDDFKPKEKSEPSQAPPRQEKEPMESPIPSSLDDDEFPDIPF